jgi:hypothetical protein
MRNAEFEKNKKNKLVVRNNSPAVFPINSFANKRKVRRAMHSRLRAVVPPSFRINFKLC